MAQTRDSKKGPLHNLALLEGGDEGWSETLGDTKLPDGQLEGPAHGSDEALEESPLLRLALHEADEEGWAETLGDAVLAHGELDGTVDGSDQGLEEGPLRKLSLLEGDEEGEKKRGVPKDWATQSMHGRAPRPGRRFRPGTRRRPTARAILLVEKATKRPVPKQ
jgi:hypothetical protein